MRVHLRHLLAAALVALFAAVPAAAQEVSGRVLDRGSDAPVQSVVVALLDSAGERVARTHSDEQGRFTLRVPAQGMYRVVAERMGYRTTASDPIQAGGRVSVDLVLRLPMRELVMDPILITAEREERLAWLENRGFYERRARSVGRFMERDEIAAQGTHRMSALVSRIPGVTYVAAVRTGFSGADVTMQRSRGCLPSLWLDGILVRPGGRHPTPREVGRTGRSGMLGPGAALTGSLRVLPADPTALSMDDLVSVDEVEALEVYRGPSEVPAVFAGGAACGAVVVWTHSGPFAQPSGSARPPLAGREGLGLLR